ncbi:hypothetical protein L0938_07725 [Paracidovorax citrulli]
MLPPDFRWHAVGTAPFDRPNSLLLDSTEVVRLFQRVDDGTWWATINNHREHLSHRTTRRCSSYEQGRAGVELWASRHQDRLRTEVDQRIKKVLAGKPFLMRGGT